MNDDDCQLRLGQFILNNPEGTFNDWTDGLVWLIRRASQNDTGARSLLEKYMPRFSAERIAEAEAIAAEPQPR